MRKILGIVGALGVACLLVAAWANARPAAGPGRNLPGPGGGPRGLNQPGPGTTRAPRPSTLSGVQSRSRAAQFQKFMNTGNAKNWQASIQSARSNWQQYWNNYHGPKPFTPAWYAQHPNAWKATHPYAHPGAAVTWVGLATWLGLTTTATPAPANYETYTETTVYDTDDGVMVSTTDTTVDVNDADGQRQAQQAAQIASRGATEEQNVEWLSLGVFGLLSNGQTQSNLTMQLSVSKNGMIRGTYYDLLSDTTRTVQGSIDKTNQRAAWYITTNPTVVFETRLNNLTENAGPVSIHFGEKQTQKWTLVQLNTEAGSNATHVD
jgi:hypothetical protein